MTVEPRCPVGEWVLFPEVVDEHGELLQRLTLCDRQPTILKSTRREARAHSGDWPHAEVHYIR